MITWTSPMTFAMFFALRDALAPGGSDTANARDLLLYLAVESLNEHPKALTAWERELSDGRKITGVGEKRAAAFEQLVTLLGDRPTQ